MDSASGSRGRWLSFATTALLVTGLLATPGAASAATSVGQATAPNGLCATGVSYLQESTAAAPAYSMPTNGVITSWSHHGNSGSAGSGKAQVWRHVSGTIYTLVGRSSTAAFTPDLLNSTPTRIPVQAGDILGLYTDVQTGCTIGTAAPADVARPVIFGPEPAPGDIRDFVGSAGSTRVNVAAVLEPDADGDGFGDETQDQCPTDASTQGTCPLPPDTPDTSAPDTTIGEGPSGKTKSKAATFAFSGTDARAVASFECKLDDGSFAACASPKAYSGLKKGSHTFSVRAVDAAGNVDPSPATRTWTVKKKKKKKK